MDAGRLAPARANAAGHAWSLQKVLGSAATHTQDYLIAAGYTVLVFMVRLLVLCLSLPLSSWRHSPGS